MKMNVWNAVACILIMIGTASCAGGREQGENQSAQQNVHIVQTKWGSPIDQTVANRAKKKVIKREEVTEVHAVNSKKELMVAVKLKTFARFNAQQITSHITKNLKKSYPGRKVQVSSDQKIFREITELENRLENGKVNSKELKKKMKRIDRFMKQQDPAEAKKQNG